MAYFVTATHPEAIRWVHDQLTPSAETLVAGGIQTVPHALLHLATAPYPNEKSSLSLYFAVSNHDQRRGYPLTLPDMSQQIVSILSDAELTAFSAFYSQLANQFSGTPSRLIFARRLNRDQLLENNPDQSLLVSALFGANAQFPWT